LLRRSQSYTKAGTTILYNAFRTTKEARLEEQPLVTKSGVVITWDGRLDNRTELISKLINPLKATAADVEIVAGAYEQWGPDCFARLIGDWALSIWNPNDHSLILAKDPIGVRHLYYSIENDQITWSTILDALVLFADRTFAICEEYIAGWFAYLPAAHLTPYVGIDAVPPSSFVLLLPGRCSISRYWDFDPSKRLRYRSDAEYEEHFRVVFATAVQRRLRSDRPVLAELSGGRDSSAIVCMADTIITLGDAKTPRLDTVSYYDDSEPNWDDHSYFTKVEQKRGRVGFHIDCGPGDPVREPPFERLQSRNYQFVPTPAHDGRTSMQIGICLDSQGNRVVLSGTGGDEVMGGVPVPTPEIQDLLASARLRVLAHQLKAWALEKRKPWFQLFFEAARGFFPPALVGVSKDIRPIPWLQLKFVKRHWAALTGYPSRVTLCHPVPSFQDNVSTLNGLRRQLACKALPSGPLYEKSYPYLDRSLLEFMYAIPREQSVRPTQRRSLMRRALVGIVPDEILNRKRKAFVVRAPLLAISKDWPKLVEMTQHMVTSSLGIVDPECLLAALQEARHGEEMFALRLTRTIYMESWLRNLGALGILTVDITAKPELVCQASS